MPPAFSTACHGSVSSTCSMPSGATRKATVLPERSVLVMRVAYPARAGHASGLGCGVSTVALSWG